MNSITMIMTGFALMTMAAILAVFISPYRLDKVEKGGVVMLFVPAMAFVIAGLFGGCGNG